MHAVIKRAAEGLGMKCLMEGLGWRSEIIIRTNASAAKPILWRRARTCVAPRCSVSWIQQKLSQKELLIEMVEGALNPANILTKYANAKEAPEQI